jgi:DNA-binding transcriptional MerR regulator
MDTSGLAVDAGFLAIREVCDELRLTLRAVRFYEARGLITPRRKSRQRFYHTTDVERLRAIVRLKSLGLSLREIRELLRSPAMGLMD